MDALATGAPHAPGLAAWWARARVNVHAANTRGWYIGASFGLIYQIIMATSIWTAPWSLAHQILVSALLVPFYAGFLFLPPMSWAESRRIRFTVIAAYWAFSLVFFPLIGSITFWLWILVGCVVATLCEDFAIAVIAIAVLVSAPLIYGFVTDFGDSAALSAVVIFSVAAMMYGINRQIQAIRELRQAQGEVARLAVVEERARFSRDMHDVIGHSLTVVTVKSELARRLVSIDPARAEAELADIERLSRAALADLRAAVAGYRSMSLSTELGAAQAALTAADIEAHLPTSAEPADELGELFGWVLREAVTNVVRHSGAHNCWVHVTRSELTIDDDGHGAREAREPGSAAAPLAAGGLGLLGLRERARQANAELTVTGSDRGGLRVAVRGPSA